MSFLKFRHGKNPKVPVQNLLGPFLPIDTIDLDYSIPAVANTLTVHCKNCKAIEKNSAAEDEDDKHHSFSGFVSVISKGCLLMYQLEMNLHDQFTYKHYQTVRLPLPPVPIHRPYITAAKWVRLQRSERKLVVLVVTSNLGVYIFSEDGSKILCNYENLEPISELVCRNITSTLSQIFIGSGRGEVHIFNFQDGELSFFSTTVIQAEPITEICSRRNVLVTGGPTGTVRVWKLNEHMATKRCCFLTKSEECVTGLGIWGGFVIATYGSGSIRIFHWESKRLMVKVLAHSRWIVGMDLLPRQGLLLTVSEDDAVLIWQLQDRSSLITSAKRVSGTSLKGLSDTKKNIRSMHGPRQRKAKISLSLNSTIQTENMLLVGGRFLNCKGSAVALANYGAKELYFYGRVPLTDE